MRWFVAVMVAALVLNACSDPPAANKAEESRVEPLPDAGRRPPDVAPRPTLPPEPQPPVAHKAHEAPALEARLQENAAYAAMWQPGHEQDRDLLLTASSELLAEGAFSGALLAALNERADVKAAAILLFGLHARTGSFPAAFTEAARRRLGSLKAEPRMGLWSPPAKGTTPYDITALAAWYHRDQPAYIRERIAAKRHGPIGWSHVKEPRPRPYLVDEQAALEWLNKLTALTVDEQARLSYLQLPGVGQQLVLGGLAYVVTGAEVSSKVGGRFARERAGDGAKYIVVRYSLENRAARTTTVLADDLLLVDAQGRQFRPSSRANTALAMGSGHKDLIVSEVQPGLKRSMATVFEVPTAVVDQPLRLVIPGKGQDAHQAVVAFRAR